MKIILLGYCLIICLGTVLLRLPISVRNGSEHSFLTSFFTATSATCVTGLVRADTYTNWSVFGQAVILTLIQIGGIGFMTICISAISLTKRNIGLTSRSLMQNSISAPQLGGIVRMTKFVSLGTLIIEGTGAMLLAFYFCPMLGFGKGIWYSIFHSISAFCNAGFDIFGVLQPGGSLIPFQTDPVVCLTLMVLIVIGGLGFFVWEDVFRAIRAHSIRHLSVYTKLVLVCTGVLIVAGTGVICALEWDNADTLGSMTVPQKLLAGAFQSVTTRTAGFASVDQGAMREATRAVSVMLMLIGGSSGSTAGGLKTVTATVLLLAAVAGARGKNHVQVFKRSVSDWQVRDAMSIAVSMVLLCFVGAIVLSVDSNVSFLNSLFETASALGTVGLTANVTPFLQLPSKIMLIAFMYFGRVGVLTISLGFLMGDRAAGRFRYAETRLLIG